MATMHTKAAQDSNVETRVVRPGGMPGRSTIDLPRTVRRATRLTRDVIIGALAGLMALVTAITVEHPRPADAAAVWSSAVFLDDNLPGAVINSAVAANRRGQAVVAWGHAVSSATPGVSTASVFVSRLDPATGVWSAAELVDQRTVGGGPSRVDVAIADNGDVIVTWNDGPVGELILGATSTAADPAWDVVVLSDQSRNATVPTVAMSDTGKGVVAWTQSVQSAPTQIHASTWTGTAWQPLVVASDPSIGGALARAAMTPDGKAVLTWTRNDGTRGVYASTLPAASNTAWSAPTLINAHSDWIAVDNDRAGNVVVAYTHFEIGDTAQAIRSRRMLAGQTTWQAETTVSDGLVSGFRPAIDVNEHGDGIVAWETGANGTRSSAYTGSSNTWTLRPILDPSPLFDTNSVTAALSTDGVAMVGFVRPVDTNGSPATFEEQRLETFRFDTTTNAWVAEQVVSTRGLWLELAADGRGDIVAGWSEAQPTAAIILRRVQARQWQNGAPVWTDVNIAVQLNVPVNDAIVASGATGYTVDSGTLPPGLAISNGGAVTGTVTVPGNYEFTMRASNASGVTRHVFRVRLEQAPVLTDQVLANPVRGVAYSDGVSATGFPAPTYSVTGGALPAGLVLDANSGAVTGTTNAPTGAYSVTIRAINSLGNQVRTVNGHVEGPPVWTDQVLARPTFQSPYADGVSASGYPAPTYSVTVGSLPVGLGLNPATGAVTGTPTVTGDYSFTIRALNTRGSITQSFTGRIGDPPVWTDQTLAPPTLGVVYADQVSASGLPAATYSVSTGSLPPGLALNATTGGLTGTPTTAGSYSFTLRAANPLGAVTASFSMGLGGAPAWTDRSLANGVPGVAYADGVAAAGAPPATYAVVSGALPPGLSLDANTGQVAGTPTTLGDYSFTIRASNIIDATDAVLTVTIGSPPTWVDTGLGSAVVGQAYLDGVAASSSAAVTYSLTQNTLPAGLTLDPTTGVITGTPTQVGNYDFTIRASNGFGFVEVGLSVLVAPAPGPDPGPAPGPGIGQPVFELVAPARLVDTRPDGNTVDGAMQRLGKVAAGGTVVVDVAGRGGVPDLADAVVLNVTTADSDDQGFFTVYPCGGEVPTASSLNQTAGSVIPNSVIAKLASDGTVCIYTLAASHVVVDVNGYAMAGRGFTSLAPARLLDTRPNSETIDGQGSGAGRVAQRGTVQVVTANRGGAPGTAAAVSLNVTVTGTAEPGYLTVYPCDEPAPNASSVNYGRGVTVANAVITKLAADGSFCIYSHEVTDVIVDINGWFADDASMTTINPERMLETRPAFATIDGRFLGGGRVAPGSTTVVQIAGRGSVPTGTSAVAVNVTAVDAAGPGFLTVFPCGTDVPTASNVNYTAGGANANVVLAALDASGNMCVFAFTEVHLIVDAVAVL